MSRIIVITVPIFYFIFSGELDLMAHNLIRRLNANTSLTSITLEGKENKNKNVTIKNHNLYKRGHY